MSRSHGAFADAVNVEVKVWMARRRLNQVELAAKIGVDQTWVSKRLSGKTATTVEDLGMIAAAMDIAAAEFYRVGDPASSINYRSSA